VVPPESLVEAVDSPRALTVRVGAVTVVALVGRDGRVRVERLLSTDPAHYLDPSLAPGADITVHAQRAAAGMGLLDDSSA